MQGNPLRSLIATTVLIGLAVVLPVATWFGGQAWLKHISSQDPVPNQNAMLLVFLGFIASVVIGFIALIFGIAYGIKAIDRGD